MPWKMCSLITVIGVSVILSKRHFNLKNNVPYKLSKKN